MGACSSWTLPAWRAWKAATTSSAWHASGTGTAATWWSGPCTPTTSLRPHRVARSAWRASAAVELSSTSPPASTSTPSTRTWSSAPTARPTTTTSFAACPKPSWCRRAVPDRLDLYVTDGIGWVLSRLHHNHHHLPTFSCTVSSLFPLSLLVSVVSTHSIFAPTFHRSPNHSLTDFDRLL